MYYALFTTRAASRMFPVRLHNIRQMLRDGPASVQGRLCGHIREEAAFTTNTHTIQDTRSSSGTQSASTVTC